MRLVPERGAFSDNLGAVLAVVSALYFSYIPVIYIANMIGIAKWLGFISVLALSLFITLLRLARADFFLPRPVVTAFALYIPFLLYAANSFAWHINYLGDYQTVAVITLINPVMIFLALMYGDRKEIMLKTMLAMSALYFIFVLRAAIFGNLLTTNDFTQVFTFASGAEYQNINIYLGFLLILVWTFPLLRNPFWHLVKLVLSVAILMLMFGVGGRASIVSAMIVLLLMLYLSDLNVAKKMTITLALAALTLFLILNLQEFLPGADLLGVRRFQVLWSGSDSSERLFLFSHAWDLFFLSPRNIFFGAGMNYFPIFIGKTTTGWYPHNLILELLAEYGIVGLALFIMPIVYLLRMRRQALGSLIGKTAAEKGSFFIFLYLLIESMFTGGLFYSWMLIFFIFMAFPGLRQRRGLASRPAVRHRTGRLERNMGLVNNS